jgi:hypothetical protein
VIEIISKKPQERKVADEFDSNRDSQEDFYEVRPSENDEIEQFRIAEAKNSKRISNHY